MPELPRQQSATMKSSKQLVTNHLTTIKQPKTKWWSNQRAQLWNKQPSLWSSSSPNPHTHKHLHHHGRKFDALCWWATPFISQITISINFFATIAAIAIDVLSSLLKSRFVKVVRRNLTRAQLSLQRWSHLAILGKTGPAPKDSASIKKQKADDDLLNVGAVRRRCSRNESIFVEAFLPRWHNTSTTRENSQPVW